MGRARTATQPARRRFPLPSIFAWYVFLVILVGTTLGALVVLHPAQWHGIQRDEWVVLLVLTASLVAGELRPIPISRGGDNTDYVTISTTFAVALVVLGPIGMAVLAQSVALLLDFIPNRTRFRNLAFNVCQYTVTIVMARWVFCLVAADKDFFSSYTYFNPGDLRELAAAFAAGLTFLVVNHALISSVVALQRGLRVLDVMVADIKFQALTSAVLVSMGPMAALAVETQWIMLPLLAAPLLAVYRSAELAIEQERRAQHDSLTDLANRELFRERAVGALREARSSGLKLSIMMIDLDHFKQINDTLGHQVGDELIIEVARRLDDAKPVGATVARLGGDEFAVLLPDVPDLSVAEDVATYLLSVLGKSFSAGGVRLVVQASIGISIAPDHGDDVHTLMRRADIALYEAKKERARFFAFRPEDDDANTKQRLSIAADLKTAVDEGQFYLEYQPKLDLQLGRIGGVEALVRWNHPSRGIIRPDDFIPLAESSGLITPITWFVVDHALHQLRDWRERGHDHLSMAVNLSVRHLTDMSLPDRIAVALDRWGIPPARLVIEVTETSVMSDPKRATDVIQHLRRVGVSVSVDDYGTGQTSLAYLKRLDIDELKIDRSFIMELDTSSSDAVIVSSTIELGHNLNLRIVAEGVETEETLRWLEAQGCDIAQGYHIGRPMLPDALEALVVQYEAAAMAADDAFVAGVSADHAPTESGAGRLRLVEG